MYKCHRWQLFDDDLWFSTTSVPQQFPIYTSQRYLPPAKLLNARLTDAMVGNGSILENCVVDSAVVGHRVRIGSGCVIRDAIVHGCDYYESDVIREQILKMGRSELSRKELHNSPVTSTQGAGRHRPQYNDQQHDCGQKLPGWR